jgi:hypothetical protein
MVAEKKLSSMFRRQIPAAYGRYPHPSSEMARNGTPPPLAKEPCYPQMNYEEIECLKEARGC